MSWTDALQGFRIGGCQLDLHGVQLNVTTIIADQNHEQHVGIEHIAIETDDYAGGQLLMPRRDS